MFIIGRQIILKDLYSCNLILYELFIYEFPNSIEKIVISLQNQFNFIVYMCIHGKHILVFETYHYIIFLQKL